MPEWILIWRLKQEAAARMERGMKTRSEAPPTFLFQPQQWTRKILLSCFFGGKRPLLLIGCAECRWFWLPFPPTLCIFSLSFQLASVVILRVLSPPPHFHSQFPTSLIIWPVGYALGLWTSYLSLILPVFHVFVLHRWIHLHPSLMGHPHFPFLFFIF